MKLLKTTKCLKCGTQIEKKHLIAGWLPIQVDKGFLGGKRIRFQKAVCDCGEIYSVIMFTDGNNFKMGDLIEVEKLEELPFEQTLQEAEEIDIAKLKRPELLELAKKLKIEGKIATLKSADLIIAIREKWKEE